jgi:hypothetical protein
MLRTENLMIDNDNSQKPIAESQKAKNINN